MAQELATPEFTVDQKIATFLASCGLLSDAWKESLGACENSLESFTLSEYKDVVYVAFPSFHRIEDFSVEKSPYGEGSIHTGNETFSGCLKGKDDLPAGVHQGALKLFLHILKNKDLEAKLENLKEVKPIIFVGHFLGGSVATLATLWMLGKRLKKSFPFCITFGSPLVGDERLVEAVGRENWRGNFCHVVSQHDIVPQILLAPFESTAQFESIAVQLNAVLNYWRGIMSNATKDVSDQFDEDAYPTLLRSLKELGGVTNGSPYRPFGVYMFCSTHGAACIENSETVLKMLHLTMQTQEKSSNEAVREHTCYGSVLEDVVQNSIRGRIAISNSESSYELGISLELDSIGVRAQNDPARLALRSAGETENKYIINVDKLASELSQRQRNMAELEWYKELCEKEDGITYYDSFKNHGFKKDMHANMCRVKLAGFWDEIIKMWENHELPLDFQTRKKWIYAGNTYSRLVEPLDIAHYYFISKSEGNYLSDGRPTRHKVLQQWFEEKEKEDKKDRTKLASLTVDSCFWAHVEEASKDLKQSQLQDIKCFEKFEDYVTKMIQGRGLSSDVFFKESSFMKWWQEYQEIQSSDWKISSELSEGMKSFVP